MATTPKPFISHKRNDNRAYHNNHINSKSDTVHTQIQ